MTEVRYFSRSGNTKSIAEAIAGAAGVEAQDVSVPLAGNTDILFLGGALYAGGIAGKLKKFIKTLSPEQVKTVVAFSTTADPKGAYVKIKKALDQQGMNALEQEFHCLGKEAKGEEARANAAQFAKEVLGQ